jgi:carbonic anhydrase
MNTVIRGIADFVRRRRPGLRATFQRLAQGQEPVALLLTCSDSRIVSSLLLGTDPGDLFEVRTVGNLVAPADAGGKASAGDRSEAAAIEYALLALEVRHVIVLGHSGCGAMKAITSGHLPKGAPNLERWLVHARGAREKLERSPWIDRALPPEDRLSQANVLQQLEHIRSYGFVGERLGRGALEFHGGWFEVATADLHVWRSAEERFIRVDEKVIAEALVRRAAVPS